MVKKGDILLVASYNNSIIMLAPPPDTRVAALHSQPITFMYYASLDQAFNDLSPTVRC